MHRLTPAELLRLLETTPGAEHLADLVDQLIRREYALRVDLDKLLPKSDES